MFQTVEGNYVPNAQELQEEFVKTCNGNYWRFEINVSAEHIDTLFVELCSKVQQPSFLIFEHGTNEKYEKELRASEQDPFHKDVFYLDGVGYEKFQTIYSKYKDLLIHDGEICFGYGALNQTDEIYVGAYKVFSIFTESPEKYELILNRNGFVEKENMITVWDKFTSETPGRRNTVNKYGIDIYDMIEDLKKEGLYLAERREDI